MQEVWFVGIVCFMDGQVDQEAVTSMMRHLMGICESAPSARVEWLLVSDKIGKTFEKKVQLQKDHTGVEQMIQDVIQSQVIRVHARTHRGEWKSAEKGYWLYCTLSSKLKPEKFSPELTVELTYPRSLFNSDVSCKGSQSIVQLLAKLNSIIPVIYGYANYGKWIRSPGFAGFDGLYAQTARSIPLSQFDDVAGGDSKRYRLAVKGAFWLNILNPDHVEKLGGIDKIRSEARPYSIEELAHGRYMILATPSPIVSDTPENREAFARLFKTFKPIFS